MPEKKNQFEGISQADINREVMSPSGYWQWRTERFSRFTQEALAKRKLDVIARIVKRVHGPVGWTNDMTDVVLNGEVPEPLFEEWVRLAEEDKRLAAEFTPKSRRQMPRRTTVKPHEFVPPTLASKYFDAMEAKEDKEDNSKS